MSLLIGASSLIILLSLLISNKAIIEWSIEKFANNTIETQLINLDVESAWHPFSPTIKINQLSIKLISNDPAPELLLDDLHLNIDIFKLLTLEPFVSLKVNGGELPVNLDNIFTSGDSGYSSNYFAFIDITGIKIGNDHQIELKRLFVNQSTGLYLELLENSGGNLIFSTGKSSIQANDYLEGYLTINNFDISPIGELIGNNLSGKLNSESWLNFVGNELLFFEGYFNLSDATFISKKDNLKGLVKLVKDSENSFFSLSNLELYTNNQNFKIPSALANFKNNGIEINIPKIDTGEATLAKKAADLAPISFRGDLENVSIKFKRGEPQITGNLINVSVIDRKDNFKIQGINGLGFYKENTAVLKLDSTKIDVSTNSFFEKDFSLTDVSGVVKLSLIKESVKYFSDDLVFLKDGEKLKGKFTHFISNDVNDLSISINTSNNRINDLKVFFPINSYTEQVRNFINKSITCGTLKESSLIYRGSLKASKSSSQNFQMAFFLDQGCLSIPGIELSKVSLFGSLNSTRLKGEIESSNFYDSDLKAKVILEPKNNKNFLSMIGSFEGPFESYFKYIGFDNAYSENIRDIKGSQKTNFNVSGDLNSFANTRNIEPNISYVINSRITNGSLQLIYPDFKVDKINSTINYDDKKGITNSFLDLRLNSEPIRFKAASLRDTLIFQSKATINTKKISESLGLGFANITGKSNFLIDIAIPLRGIRKPSLNIISDLRGTNFYLISNIRKTKNQEINFDFNSTLTPQDIDLDLMIGDLLNAKLRVKDNIVSGVVVANPTSDIRELASHKLGKLKITGEVKDLNLGSLFTGNQQTNLSIPTNIYLEDFYIRKPILGDLKLDQVEVNLENKKELIFVNLEGNQINGNFYLSEDLTKGLVMSLDYIIFNSSDENIKNSIWESFPPNLNFPITFFSKEVVLNGEYFGAWSFDLSINKEVISFNNLSGSFGEFKIGDRISFPELFPEDNPFTKINEFNSGKKIDQFIEQGGWSISSKTDLKFYRGQKNNYSKFSGILSTNSLSNAMGLEYSGTKVEAGDLYLLLDLEWKGAPEEIDLNLLKGKAEFRLDELTIAEVSEDLSNANNILRLIRVFNIADTFGSLTDIFNRPFKEGFYSDRVEGFINISPNKLNTIKPMTFKSGSGEFKWDGYVLRDSQGNFSEVDFNIVMTLPLRDYLPAYALILGGPLSAVGVYVAGKTFKRPLNKLSSGKWRVWGDLNNLKAEFIEWFE